MSTCALLTFNVMRNLFAGVASISGGSWRVSPEAMPCSCCAVVSGTAVVGVVVVDDVVVVGADGFVASVWPLLQAATAITKSARKPVREGERIGPVRRTA